LAGSLNAFAGSLDATSFQQQAPGGGQSGAGPERRDHLQAPPEAVELDHLPAMLRGYPPQRPVGIDDDRVTDRLQHRQVRLRV
jgi:hypothetical protein